MSRWVGGRAGRRLGLQQQLFAILFVVAMLATLSALLLLLTLGRVEDALRQIGGRDLEQFSLAQRLSNQAQALVAQVPNLVRSGSEAAIEGARVRVDEEIQGVSETVKRLSGAGLGGEASQELLGFIDELKSNVAQLEQIARRRLALEESLHRSHHRLEVMRQALPPPSMSEGRGGDLRLKLYELWAASLSGLQLTDPVELQGLVRQVAASATSYQREVQAKELPAALRRPLLASLDLLRGAESPVKLRLELLRLNFLLDTRLSVNAALSDRFLASAAQYNQATRDSVRVTSGGLEVLIQRQRLASLLALGAMALGVVGVGVFASYFLVRRLRVLLDAVQARREGQAQGALPDLGQNEVGDLARELAYYLDLLNKREDATRAARDSAEQALEALRRAQDQLVQSERMAVLGQLVANVAHEINTPIAAVKSSGQHIAQVTDQWLTELPALLESLAPDELTCYLALIDAGRMAQALETPREERARVRATEEQLRALGVKEASSLALRLVQINPVLSVSETLPLWRSAHALPLAESALRLISLLGSARNINVAVDQVTKIVFALKSYSRAGAEGPKAQVDLREGLDMVLTLYQNAIKRGVELIRHYEVTPPVACWPDQLNQVWTNLIHNALQAMAYKGKLEVGLKQKGHHVEVFVRDSGPGIPADIQQRIFDPFFTTKPAGEGSGLGLDIVRRIVEKHGGRIEVQSEPEQGATFTVVLPIGDLATHEARP